MLQTKELGTVSQSIDNLVMFNDGGEFEQSFKEVYALGLALKKKNLSTSVDSILHLFVKTEKNQF